MLVRALEVEVTQYVETHQEHDCTAQYPMLAECVSKVRGGVRFVDGIQLERKDNTAEGAAWSQKPVHMI